MSTQELKPGTSYPAVVGSVLVKLRCERNVLQGDLAEAVGVTQATWSRIENGSSALTIEQIALAAGRLGVSPHSILSYADEAAEELRQRGVRVELTRNSLSLESGIALIGAAALGALIATIIFKAK